MDHSARPTMARLLLDVLRPLLADRNTPLRRSVCGAPALTCQDLVTLTYKQSAASSTRRPYGHMTDFAFGTYMMRR